jgi:hypothetical protein
LCLKKEFRIFYYHASIRCDKWITHVVRESCVNSLPIRGDINCDVGTGC